MIHMTLAQAAACTGAYLPAESRKLEFSGCSTDSRTINRNELFIAIKGDRFDGHDYIGGAGQRGACAALVEKKVSATLPVLQVENTRKAMGMLACHWRKNFSVPVIAITGSNGKTTVKEMLVSILSKQAPVLSTKGNLNNDIGVPLTLFGFGTEHRYAVVEMGANHPGEILWLSRMAQPTVAVITQCAPAHLEGFGSIEGVARAKSEIYAGLDKHGIAVINADDNYAAMWRAGTTHLRQIGFGLNEGADVTAHSIKLSTLTSGTDFVLRSPAGEISISLKLPGLHNVMNALAATACVTGLNIPLKAVRDGLQNIKPVKGRLERKAGRNHSTVIDDTYNANPASLAAALNVIKLLPGRHWLALGDMGELGGDAECMHAEAGKIAKQSGIEKLFAIGPLSRAAVSAFGAGAEHFSDTTRLIDQVRAQLAPDVTLLVKGSRAMKMEQIVQGLEGNASC